MKSRIYYYGVQLEYDCCTVTQNKQHIKKFLKAALTAMGLKSGIDFSVSLDSLYIRHIKDKVEKVLTTVKETFPVFNFYWETPRRLVWF